MEIKVMNREKAKRYSFESHIEKSIMISITDIDSKINNIKYNQENGIKAVLHLKFDDCEKGDKNCITNKDAQEIAEFCYKYKEMVNLIIVHCEAGISRSAGVAAALSKIFNNDDSFFFGNGYTPNMTCYRKVMNSFISVT